MKLANAFSSATALAAFSGRSRSIQLVDQMATMLEVLKKSNEQNTATSERRSNHELNGTLRIGFHELADGEGSACSTCVQC